MDSRHIFYRRLTPRWLISLALIVGLLASSLSISVPIARADTGVGGPIFEDTTWTLAGSPYIVVSNVLVMEGVTLTIEPGVEVRFNASKALQIDGELIAQGADASPITFTSNAGVPGPGDWSYILFTDTSVDATYDDAGIYVGGSILQYCVVEYGGGGGVKGAIIVDSSSPFINQSIIRNNGSSGIYGTYLAATGVPRITHNTISNNPAPGGWVDEGGGIRVESTQAVEIANNTISGNHAVFGGGIWTQGTSSASIYIDDNVIIDNTAGGAGGGIWARYSVITHNLIANNSAEEWSSHCEGGGMSVTDSTVAKNVVRNNSVSGANGSTGGGIWAGRWLEGSTVTDNIIVENVAASSSTHSADTGGGIYASGSIVSRNVIADNRAVGAGDGTSGHHPPYGGGLFAEWSGIGTTLIITNNTIVRNSVSGSAQYPGAYLSGADSFSRNTVTDNTAPSGAALGASGFTWEGGPFITLVLNNSNISNKTPLELRNDNEQGTPNLDATSNWWGTTDSAEIADKIYDWFDDSTKGLVDYIPYLTSPDTDAPISPPTGLTATLSGASISLSWSPNLESDLSGYKVYYDTDSGFPYSGTGANEGDSPIDVGHTTAFTLTGFSPGTCYYIAIAAYDTAANGTDDQTEGHESWYSGEEAVDLATPQPPSAGTFEPNGGSGRVGEWADFATTYSDPNGYEDITWAFFFLDRAPPIASGGLAAAYIHPSNILWLKDGGICRPGQAKSLTTAYITLDCGNSSISGVGDVLTINWHVCPEQCFVGGCGVNRAYEFVTDSTGLRDFGAVGTWTLNPASGAIQDTGPAVELTEADLERLMENIKAWQSQFGEP